MTKEEIKEKRYEGYFLMDSGIRIPFDISEEEGGGNFAVSLYGDSKFPFLKGDSIWLGVDNDVRLLVDRIIGWSIKEYFQESI